MFPRFFFLVPKLTRDVATENCGFWRFEQPFGLHDHHGSWCHEVMFLGFPAQLDGLFVGKKYCMLMSFIPKNFGNIVLTPRCIILYLVQHD